MSSLEAIFGSLGGNCSNVGDETKVQGGQVFVKDHIVSRAELGI